MNVRWCYRLWPVVLLLGWVSGMEAFQQPDREPLPSVDRRLEAKRNAAALAGPMAPAPKELQVTRDPLLDAPKFIVAKQGFLTEADPPADKVRAALTPPALPDPNAAVKRFITRNDGWLKHGAEVLERSRVERDYVTEHNGLRTVVWQQQIGQIDVFGGRLIAHVTARGELASFTSGMLPQAEAKLAKSARQKSLAEKPEVSASRALAAAAKDVGESDFAEKSVTRTGAAPAGREARQRLKAPGVLEEAMARLVWLPMDANELRLAWELIFYARSSGHLFRSVVDAETGEVWVRHALTKFAEPASFRVFTQDSPSPMSPGWSTPSTTQPPVIPRELVTLTALNTNASPDGWINPGDYETVGNNVQAHTDRDRDNQPDLPRPTATNRVFDFPLDLSANPASYGEAAVVNLFYWCNFAHDRMYELGFTEMVGNFQTTNFNRGGAGGDAVIADAQDGEGFNNANFSTPPQDGLAPRMQMYLFSSPNPDRDGAYDAEVILHEYAHGLSDRLVGSGYGIYDSQSSGMAEGWSDFMAMALLSEAQDGLSGNHPFSGYVARLFGGLTENYYYGLRRYPYSTNLAVNPLTLKDIDPSQASWHSGVPRNPAIGGSAAEVHNQGEVWCATLWDMRARLVRKHGFEAGNRLAMQLVVDGMRGSPSNPTFLNARDAILLADRVNNQNANRTEIWAAFARRGMGAQASVPPSYTTVGVVEDFSMPEDFEVSPTSMITVNGVVGGPFDPPSINFELFNAGQQALHWRATGDVLLKLSTNFGVLPAESTTNLTATLAAVATELPAGTYTQTVSLVNAASESNQVRFVKLVIREQKNYLLEVFDRADFDLAYSTLTFTPDDSLAGYQVCWQAATNLPTDPADGQPVSLGDDWYVPLTITNGGSVDIFGVRSNIFYLSSNGQLAMSMGNTQFFQPELHVFYEQARAAALYADLHPAQSNSVTGELSARVSWKQLADRAAVSWVDVPEYGINNSNTLQIELFFNGLIRMTWLRVDAGTAKVGLSPGRGIPAGLVENDFSASTICGRELALQVPNGIEGQGTVAQAGWVAVSEPPAADLEVTLSSESTSEVILPASVVIPAGLTSQWFAVSYPDDTLWDGPRRTRVHAQAPEYTPAQMLVAVLDNESAILSLHFPAQVDEGAGEVADIGEVWIHPPPEEAILIGLSATGLAQVLDPPFVIMGAGKSVATFPLRVLDNQTLEGLSAAEVRAEVPGWGVAIGLLQVRDNESFSLNLAVPANAGETFGVMSNAGLVSVAGPLAFDLVVLLESSQPDRLEVPSALVIPAGQSSAAFSIRILDDLVVNRSNWVMVSVSAPGFAGTNAAISLSDDESLAAPLLLAPAAGASDISLTPRLTWYSGTGELLVNGDFETGDFTGWSNVVSLDGSSFALNQGTLVTAQGAGPFAPLGGSFEALSHPVNAGCRELSQEITLPALPGSLMLSWRHQIRNYAEAYTATHQFRVELRDAVQGSLLATFFATQPGDALRPAAATGQADLGAWKGRQVRLAFVVADSLGALNVSVDDVSLAFYPSAAGQFEVYLGTSSNLGPEQLLGVTTNNHWAVATPLEQLFIYYWKVVARRGSESAASEERGFVTVGAAPPPAVAISSVTNFTSINVPAAVILSATATSPAGVVKVSYYDGEVELGEAAAPPYTVVYHLNSSGQRQLRAVMLDGAGQSVSSPVATVIGIPSGDQPVALLPAGTTWKYLDDGSDQGGAWHAAGFDDAQWPAGQGRFGYGIGGETTTLAFGPDPQNKHITTYFRTALTNDANLHSLTLRLICDDGIVIWINEQPMRINMPGLTAISYNDRAVEEVVGEAQTNYVVYNLHPWVLPRGPVTLAVELHQHTNNGPDLAFDLLLEGSGNYRPFVALNAPASGALLPADQAVLISANAFDRYGRLSVVEYYADGQKIGETRSEPHSMVWSNAPAGSHYITARAEDSAGAEAWSDAVWVTVGQVSLVGPLVDGDTCWLGWPQAGTNAYWLEAAPRLNQPEWQVVTNAVVTTNGLNQVWLPIEGGQRYFRLRSP